MQTSQVSLKLNDTTGRVLKNDETGKRLTAPGGYVLIRRMYARKNSVVSRARAIPAMPALRASNLLLGLLSSAILALLILTYGAGSG
jgi:hypothetical protein